MDFINRYHVVFLSNLSRTNWHSDLKRIGAFMSRCYVIDQYTPKSNAAELAVILKEMPMGN